MPWRSFWSVLLNVSYYKTPEYIWFRDGDRNGFQDIKPFYEVKGVGMPLGDFPVSDIECLLLKTA